MNKELAQTKSQPAEEAVPSYRKPQYMVHADENAYRIEVHLPGVAKDAARLTLDGNLLVIEAEPAVVRQESWRAFRREIPEGGFKLSLELNVDIDEEAIGAKSADGVLTVTLPVAAKAAKRNIAIE